MPVAAAAPAVTFPITSPGSWSSKSSSRRTPELLEEHRVVAPVPRVHVDRPLKQDVVRGRVAERAGETVAEIARGRRRVREGGVVGQVRLVGAVVHPADHRLDERSVCREERLAAADRAEADGHDLARVAVEACHRLAACCGERVPEVVVGMEDDAVLRPAERPQRLPPLGDHLPRGVDDDDLRALRAAVDADQVRAARHASSRPRPNGRDSRRPPRGRAR